MMRQSPKPCFSGWRCGEPQLLPGESIMRLDYPLRLVDRNLATEKLVGWSYLLFGDRGGYFPIWSMGLEPTVHAVPRTFSEHPDQ
jgi:hypothetical protein